MISFQTLRRHASRIAALVLVTLSILLNSCTSPSGLPDKLPDIALNSTTATPPHHMAGYEYPFDSSGNYVGEWAAEGERRAGRSAIATNSDEDSWSKSHGNRNSTSSMKKAVYVKSKSSTNKKSTGTKTGGDKPKSSSSKKYVVKSSDSLSSIARKFGTTTASIKKSNGLKSDKVRSGTVLVIPK